MNQEFEITGGGFKAMKSERRQQIKRIFGEAAKLAPADRADEKPQV